MRQPPKAHATLATGNSAFLSYLLRSSNLQVVSRGECACVCGFIFGGLGVFGGIGRGPSWPFTVSNRARAWCRKTQEAIVIHVIRVIKGY